MINQEPVSKIEVFDIESAYHSIMLSNYLYEHGIEDILDLFEGNNSQIKMNGDEIPFVEIKTEGSCLVIYMDVHYECDREILKTILEKFHADNFKEYFKTGISTDAEYKDNCIAFLDQSGFHYTIWEYTS